MPRRFEAVLDNRTGCAGEFRRLTEACQMAKRRQLSAKFMAPAAADPDAGAREDAFLKEMGLA